MNKDILKKLEKQLAAIKNTKSDYDNFISKFTDMIADNSELLDWAENEFK